MAVCQIPEDDELTQLTHDFGEISSAYTNLSEAISEAGRQLLEAFERAFQVASASYSIDHGQTWTNLDTSTPDYKQWVIDRQEAKHKAEVLLMSLLNRRQKKEYKQKRQISIYEGRERKWILRKRDNYNIVECENGRPVRAYCVQTDTPLADQLATQFLYLKHSPQELLAMANVREYGMKWIHAERWFQW
jgi:hypothetical protein